MKRAVVAMSGGVDSSVACAILKEKGFDVVGITLRFFSTSQQVSCCGAQESAAKARQVCQTLGIRHYLKDARALFKKDVTDNFILQYLSGKTPNPCVECNRSLKFNYLFSIAAGLGADYLATGHYAIIKNADDGPGLFRGRDPLKDQSYFLYCIRKEFLGRIIFPLGDMEKRETREIAGRFTLPNARSAESKDICFIPKGDYRLWLKENGMADNIPGYIKDDSGKILGRHNGFFYFTIGQRKNLGISSSSRLYVSEIKPETNEVIVSTLDKAMFSGCRIANLNWLGPQKPQGEFSVQIRYRHKPCRCELKKDGDGFLVSFEKKQFAAAPGQSAVFYEGDRVLGGGIIDETFR